MGLFKSLCACTLLLISGQVDAYGSDAFDTPSPQLVSAALDTSTLTAPIPPRQDPFYTAPDGYKTAIPGTILRSRIAPGNLSAVIPNTAVAYNLLYATTNSKNLADWAVTTIIVPRGGNGMHLLSYQIPYDSDDLDTSPSYALYSGPPADINVALGMGWYVNVPDYEGPLASFTAGVQSGHATLDSVRASLAYAKTRFLKQNATYAMWGYSGGALASEWAAELQVKYAPELKFAGVSLGGLTPNITSVLFTINQTPFVGLAPAGIVGISSQFPQLHKFIVKNLKKTGPYNATGFFNCVNQTLAQSISYYANQDLGAYFVNGINTLNEPIALKFTNRDGLMGTHGVPRMPVFAYKAINDNISVIADTDALVKKYCAKNAEILYQRNTVGGHQAESINGDSRAFSFLESVFNGTFQQNGCVIQNVTVNITSLPY